MKAALLAAILFVAACDDTKNNAHNEVARLGLRAYDCLNVDGYKQSDLSFCIGDRVLIICDRDRCITVQLDALTAEAP